MDQNATLGQWALGIGFVVAVLFGFWHYYVAPNGSRVTAVAAPAVAAPVYAPVVKLPSCQSAEGLASAQRVFADGTLDGTFHVKIIVLKTETATTISTGRNFEQCEATVLLSNGRQATLSYSFEREKSLSNNYTILVAIK
jgi:hypothetical protein